MKTPKRKFGLDKKWTRYQQTRWKRKNRVAQLKRSLTRYKHGTNLPFYCHELHAYLLLQQLSRPSKKATAAEWNFYSLELTEIRAHIEEAMMQACREERQKREEETACHAQNAENAKQDGLTCADAEQQTARKDQA